MFLAYTGLAKMQDWTLKEIHYCFQNLGTLSAFWMTLKKWKWSIYVDVFI